VINLNPFLPYWLIMAPVKAQNSKNIFQNYLNKGLDIINKDDQAYVNLVSDINDLLGELDSKMPESDIVALVFLTLLKDKEMCEKKLNDITNSYDEVLGLLTHEFKNILTSIHGYNMLLENQLDQDKDSESYKHLKDSDRLTRQLFDMTDSLLKMSLGEKGLIKPELKLVDFIEDMLVPIQRDLQANLENKKMQIVVKCQTKDRVVECDEGLLDIVVRNLLLNAIKYGKQKSEISVTIERTATDFKVSIKNFCNVIPADLCEDIFEKFKSRPIGKEKGGTGIGLYNVRNIIHLHQGNITCKSSAKNWIKFMFSIPQNI
jgi:signal transduction histidine kinase